MALERWAKVQQERGNTAGFEIGRTLIRLFGDVPLDSQFIPEQQLVSSEQEAWFRFLGHKVEISNPPPELSATLLKAHEIGWTQAEPHFLPKIELEQNSDFPGWTVKPEEWYWQKIREGKVARDAATLDGVWVIIDGSQKPQYADGKQMYENDPFAPLLKQLREEGKIQVPYWCKDIPKDSRFGISHDEIRKHVNPAIATLLGVQPEQVGALKEIEFNVLGNLAHPEWGNKTTTSEWFQDKFEDGSRLFGGRSDDGGLGDVAYEASGGHYGDLGFRPLVVFPQF